MFETEDNAIHFLLEGDALSAMAASAEKDAAPDNLHFLRSRCGHFGEFSGMYQVRAVRTQLSKGQHV